MSSPRTEDALQENCAISQLESCVEEFFRNLTNEIVKVPFSNKEGQTLEQFITSSIDAFDTHFSSLLKKKFISQQITPEEIKFLDLLGFMGCVKTFEENSSLLNFLPFSELVMIAISSIPSPAFKETDPLNKNAYTRMFKDRPEAMLSLNKILEEKRVAIINKFLLPLLCEKITSKNIEIDYLSFLLFLVLKNYRNTVFLTRLHQAIIASGDDTYLLIWECLNKEIISTKIDNHATDLKSTATSSIAAIRDLLKKSHPEIKLMAVLPLNQPATSPLKADEKEEEINYELLRKAYDKDDPDLLKDCSNANELLTREFYESYNGQSLLETAAADGKVRLVMAIVNAVKSIEDTETQNLLQKQISRAIQAAIKDGHCNVLGVLQENCSVSQLDSCTKGFLHRITSEIESIVSPAQVEPAHKQRIISLIDNFDQDLSTLLKKAILQKKETGGVQFYAALGFLGCFKTFKANSSSLLTFSFSDLVTIAISTMPTPPFEESKETQYVNIYIFMFKEYPLTLLKLNEFLKEKRAEIINTFLLPLFRKKILDQRQAFDLDDLANLLFFTFNMYNDHDFITGILRAIIKSKNGNYLSVWNKSKPDKHNDPALKSSLSTAKNNTPKKDPQALIDTNSVDKLTKTFESSSGKNKTQSAFQLIRSHLIDLIKKNHSNVSDLEINKLVKALQSQEAQPFKGIINFKVKTNNGNDYFIVNKKVLKKILLHMRSSGKKQKVENYIAQLKNEFAASINKEIESASRKEIQSILPAAKEHTASENSPEPKLEQSDPLPPLPPSPLPLGEKSISNDSKQQVSEKTHVVTANELASPEKIPLLSPATTTSGSSPESDLEKSAPQQLPSSLLLNADEKNTSSDSKQQVSEKTHVVTAYELASPEEIPLLSPAATTSGSSPEPNLEQSDPLPPLPPSPLLLDEKSTSNNSVVPQNNFITTNELVSPEEIPLFSPATEEDTTSESSPELYIEKSDALPSSLLLNDSKQQVSEKILENNSTTAAVISILKETKQETTQEIAPLPLVNNNLPPIPAAANVAPHAIGEAFLLSDHSDILDSSNIAVEVALSTLGITL